MLILTRLVNEGVTITVDGRKIHVVVTEILPHKVRLGFTADPDVTIHRDEVEERISREQQ
jgi:carbon storage regulator CsrA